MRDTKKLTEYAEKTKRKLKENFLFKHLVKAVESGANGTFKYIIKSGPGKGKGTKKIMYVRHLQEYLDKFTDGTKGNAVSNATIYMDNGSGNIFPIGTIEVQESTIIGKPSVRVVIKPDLKDQIPKLKKFILT